MAAKEENSKKLFLVDAMAHIYRAFFAPMPMRLSAPNGTPTNVPFLFGNILKRLINDYQPKYIGIVFDPPGATFRDKLFEKYKAQRSPMPDDMKVQIPLVHRLCEAMRLPILELLPPAQRAKIRSLLSHNPQTAGGMMNPDFISVAPETTVGDALARL